MSLILVAIIFNLAFASQELHDKNFALLFQEGIVQKEIKFSGKIPGYKGCLDKVIETLYFKSKDSLLEFFGRNSKKSQYYFSGFLKKEKGLFVVDKHNRYFFSLADFKNKKANELFTKEKNKKLGLYVFKDGEYLYVGTKTLLEKEALSLKSKVKVKGQTIEVSDDFKISMANNLMNSLPVVEKVFHKKLDLSRSQSRFDYTGLGELAALYHCHQTFSSEPTTLAAIEKSLSELNPNWKKALEGDKPKSPQKAPIKTP